MNAAAEITLVVAERDSSGVRTKWRTLAVLPDADHVHLARQADGTVTVTPMRYFGVSDAGHLLRPHEVGDPLPTDKLLFEDLPWVDEVSS